LVLVSSADLALRSVALLSIVARWWSMVCRSLMYSTDSTPRPTSRTALSTANTIAALARPGAGTGEGA